jgi:two-component system OmpR family response regulator
MPKTINVVVVEDNLSLQELMVEHLSANGYRAIGVSCAEELDERLVETKPDILLLDINLPGEDGISIATRLTQAHPNMRIAMLTARVADKDKTIGYGSGADMYLTKPASPDEILAAVASLSRRIAQDNHGAEILLLELAKSQLGGRLGQVRLTTAEALMLKALAEAPNQKLEYWRLLELLNKPATEKAKSALGVAMHRLKLKMVGVGAESPAIKSLFKEGYQLGIPVQII